MRLYQFIHSDFAVAAIGLRRLKISRIDELNDPFELLAGTQSDAEVRFAMSVLRQEVARHLGLLCFSRDWKNPVMWSHYADRHRGLCLAFDVDDRIALPVQYVSRRPSFDHFMHPAPEPTEIRKLVEHLISTKYAHWRYEKEVRTWVSLIPSGPAIQFYNFDHKVRLRGVYIGCRSNITRRDISAALGDELEDSVEVHNTRLAFRTFRVVKQRDKRLWK